MWIRPRPGVIAATAAVFLGALALVGGIATAAPSPTPVPGPAATSSSDELADMVMDVVQRSGPPTTAPVPAPPAG